MRYVVGTLGLLLWGNEAWHALLIAERHWGRDRLDVLVVLFLLLPMQLAFMAVSVYVMLPQRKRT